MNEVTISKMGRCSHPIGGGCLVTLTVATDSQNAGAALALESDRVAHRVCSFSANLRDGLSAWRDLERCLLRKGPPVQKSL